MGRKNTIVAAPATNMSSTSSSAWATDPKNFTSARICLYKSTVWRVFKVLQGSVAMSTLKIWAIKVESLLVCLLALLSCCLLTWCLGANWGELRCWNLGSMIISKATETWNIHRIFVRLCWRILSPEKSPNPVVPGQAGEVSERRYL